MELMNATFDESSSYRIIPGLMKETISLERHFSKTYKVYGTSSCEVARTLIMRQKKPQQNNKSTCPWFVYLDYDSERLPQIIAKAGCTCTNCTGVMDAFSSGPGRCEAVESFRTVLRRKCESGSDCEYSLGVEAVPVGCSCNRVVYSGQSSNAAPAVTGLSKVYHMHHKPPP